MTPVRKIFAAMMFAGFAASSAAAGLAQPGHGEMDTQTMSVDAEKPSLIRFEGESAGRLELAAGGDWVKVIDRSSDLLLVAVEEAGRYDFFEPGPSRGELQISVAEVEISRGSFWLHSPAGRLAIDRTTYRATPSEVAKNEEETDPDPPSKNEEETDPDPPSGSGWTAQGDSPSATYVEVRDGFYGERLMTVSVSSWPGERDRAEAARLGLRQSLSSALIVRPASVAKNEEETDPDPPHKNEEETDPDPPSKLAAENSWRVLVAGEGSSHLEIAAWAAPLTWSELARPQGLALRLVSFGAAPRRGDQ